MALNILDCFMRFLIDQQFSLYLFKQYKQALWFELFIVNMCCDVEHTVMYTVWVEALL